MMHLTVILLCSWISTINSFLCDTHESLFCNELGISKAGTCNPSKFDVYSETCTLDTREKSNDFSKGTFGDVFLWLNTRNWNSTTSLKSTLLFQEKYKEAYIKLSESIDQKNSNCTQFTMETKAMMSAVFFNCLWYSIKQPQTDYLMEITVLKDVLYVPKKLLFNVPDPLLYGDHVALDQRLIFSYIDFSDINKVILKIQQLSEFYNVTHYKVEVFKEKDKKVQVVDIRLLSHDSKSKYLDFEYLTFNEEGFHYFTISVISPTCPEDACKKTVTAKLYISRKGTRLIIGIVGASFIIPIILYIFYVWTYKHKYFGEFAEACEKVLILYDPSFNQHNEVVAALARVVKHLTGIDVIVDPLNITKNTKENLLKQCSDNLILSSYIIYLTPPVTGEADDCCKVDGMTYNFLKKEIQKPNSEKKIVIISFPYTNNETPPFLNGCSKFELMKDFTSFVHIFEQFIESVNFENDPVCKELSDKVKKAQFETENLLTDLPNIVIEHSEPREIDVLL